MIATYGGEEVTLHFSEADSLSLYRYTAPFAGKYVFSANYSYRTNDDLEEAIDLKKDDKVEVDEKGVKVNGVYVKRWNEHLDNLVGEELCKKAPID